MALFRLTTATMASLTAHWIGPAADVLQRPMLQSLLPLFETLNGQFEQILKPPAEADVERLAALRAQTSQLDATHDTALVACWSYLTAVSDFLAGERRDAVMALRDRLMPGGRKMRMRAYQDEGTAAATAKAAFTDDDRALLATLSLPEIDLNAWMDRWIDAGLALRAADAERAGLQATLARPTGQPNERKVRNRWMLLAGHLRSAVALDADLPLAQRDLLLAKLDEADRRSDSSARPLVPDETGGGDSRDGESGAAPTDD